MGKHTEGEEGTSWASIAVLAAAGLGAGLLIWRSYVNDAPAARSYQAPAAPAAPSMPAAPPTLAEQAEAHFTARRFGEAAAVYRKMLELSPKDAGVYNELGLCLHYDGRTDEAVAALKKATAIDPRLQRAWLSLGFVLKSAGRDAAAKAALEKAVALDPASAPGVEAAAMLKR